ncbi:MAG: hypothetical protein HDR23_07630 [Lachnospiraceae bacterium]|nr:hypothetical protein [Lachnospiraceae bacterium]
MKRYKVSSRYLDKCISTIELNCYNHPSGAFTGDALKQFCSKPKNIQAIRLLEATHEIKTFIPNNSVTPEIIWLNDKGILHSYEKTEKRMSAIKGFIAGVMTTLISTTILPYLFNLLTSQLIIWLQQ